MRFSGPHDHHGGLGVDNPGLGPNVRRNLSGRQSGPGFGGGRRAAERIKNKDK